MKALVPTEGSKKPMKAVQRALEMAEWQGAKVTLMSVPFSSLGNVSWQRQSEVRSGMPQEISQ